MNVYEHEKTALARLLGIPLGVVDNISFTVFHVALSMFINVTALYNLESHASYAPYGDTFISSELSRFRIAWERTGHDSIIFGDGGALFKSFGTIEERLVELQAVPRLKARGFDDARLVAIIRDGGRFSTVLEALGNDILRYHDENIPSEYMVRTDV